MVRCSIRRVGSEPGPARQEGSPDRPGREPKVRPAWDRWGMPVPPLARRQPEADSISTGTLQMLVPNLRSRSRAPPRSRMGRDSVLASPVRGPAGRAAGASAGCLGRGPAVQGAGDPGGPLDTLRPVVGEVSDDPRCPTGRQVVTGGKTRVEVPASRGQPTDGVRAAMSRSRQRFDQDDDVIVRHIASIGHKKHTYSS